MAEIDTNPLGPVWPKPPARRIDPEEKGAEHQRERRQRREEQEQKQNNNDDSSPHIDEYA